MTRAAEHVDLLLMDANAICYACAYQPNLAQLEHRGQPTGVLTGAIHSVAKAVASHPNALPIVLWDGRAQWRYDLLPEYKSGRDDTPQKLHAKALVRTQTPWIRVLLQELGIPQMVHPHGEADDLAGWISTGLKDHPVTIRLLSPDTDWWQAISDQVDWQSDVQSEPIGLTGMQRLKGSKKIPEDGWRSPQEYLQAKILSGDQSDRIPGIDGVGPITAAKLLRATPGGIDGILAGQCPLAGKVADRLRMPESAAMIRRNTRLMDWLCGDRLSAHDLAAWAYPQNCRMAADYAREHGMSALAKRIETGCGAKDHSAHPVWHQAIAAMDVAAWA